jgi:hypothetical protein
LDTVIGILLQIPRIYQKGDQAFAKQSWAEALPATLELISSGWKLKKDLDDWFQRLQSRVSGPVFWPRTDPDEEERTGLEAHYEFVRYNVAQSMVLYWLGLFLARVHLRHTTERMRVRAIAEGPDSKCTCRETKPPALRKWKSASVTCPRHFSTEQLPALHSETQCLRDKTHHIIKSADYLMQEGMRSAGPASLLPPLLTIRAHIPYLRGDWSEEVNWIDAQRAKIRGRGVGIANHVF